MFRLKLAWIHSQHLGKWKSHDDCLNARFVEQTVASIQQLIITPEILKNGQKIGNVSKTEITRSNSQIKPISSR
jgi:hypothetical protein